MALKNKADFGNTEQFKFEKKGTKLDGYYKGTTDIVIEGRDVKKHVFNTSKGLVSVLGQTHLTQLLQDIPLNCRVVATYVDTKVIKKGFNPMKMFELQYDEEEKDPGASLDLSEESIEDEAVEEEYADEVVEDEVVEEEPQQPVRRASTPSSKPTSGATRSPLSAEQKARQNALLGKR